MSDRVDTGSGTANSASWSIGPPPTKGEEAVVHTAELSGMVQELVDLEDWTGAANAATFVFARTTGSNSLVATTAHPPPYNAMHVAYVRVYVQPGHGALKHVKMILRPPCQLSRPPFCFLNALGHPTLEPVVCYSEHHAPRPARTNNRTPHPFYNAKMWRQVHFARV